MPHMPEHQRLTGHGAIELGRRSHTFPEGTGLQAQEVAEFPGIWYVTEVVDARATTGGSACVAHRPAARAFEVPGSKPPRASCAEVSASIWQTSIDQ